MDAEAFGCGVAIQAPAFLPSLLHPTKLRRVPLALPGPSLYYQSLLSE